MTKEEIYNDILTEHDKETAINKIPARATSDTLGAIYRAISAGIKTFADAIDEFKSWFNEVRFTAVTPSTAWLGYKATKYQHGDSLVFVNGAMTYPSENTEKQIIHCASVEYVYGQTYCKAAKLNKDTGLLEVLTTQEYSGLYSYMNQIVCADTMLVINQFVESDIDKLILEAKIYVDATKISNTGTAQYDSKVFPVINAINILLANYSNQNNFNAELSVSQIENAIRGVDGVKNVIITACTVISDGNTFDIINTQTKSFIPNVGFFLLKNDGVVPTTTLNYLLTW